MITSLSDKKAWTQRAHAFGSENCKDSEKHSGRPVVFGRSAAHLPSVTAPRTRSTNQ